MLNDTDRRLLARTLELASLGGRAVAPNPKVGAVIVDSDRIISEGYHAAYGGPHAEAVALEHAGSESRGGTLYCNLEPCSYSAPDKHNGPCTERIIEAGVSRVVVGQLDPNERVRGGGVAALRAAGIEVDMPNEFPDGWYENAAFNTHASLSRPFVTLKLAQSLDGKIAARGGDSKWITDEKARAEVHELRAAHDAVLVGIGTALSDNPRLTARRGATTTEQAAEEPPYPRQPLAVVLDASLQLPPDSRLVSERAHELVVLDSDAPHDHEPGPPVDSNRLDARAAELTRRGVTVVPTAVDAAGRIRLDAALHALWERGIKSVLVEGGADVATSFIREGLFDAFRAYIAPRLIGADGAGIGELGVASIDDSEFLEAVEVRSLGKQAVIHGFRSGWLREVQAQSVQTRRVPSRPVHAPSKEDTHVHGVG